MSEVVSAQKQDSSHVLEENYGLFDSLCSAGRVFELQNGVKRNIQISTMPELNYDISMWKNTSSGDMLVK